ncbi:MAG TPA: RIP metalloprotease RseP [Xanthobacteraceae bacterium]|jgi:regulator of sigma E protease|nr:RIP metalloprotease RseP [Xanthobacteraceae bacterium]
MGSYLLSHLHALGGGVVGYLIPFIFVLSVVVFFHEFGHFIVARLCGVRVLVFSIGFGPELFGFNDRHGTRWKVSAIPLGGYVKFFGDENAASVPETQQLESMNASERAESFFFQPVRKRAAIVFAGPAANFILAVVIFAGIFAIYGKQSMSARVDQVQADSAAAAAGFQPGDVVLAINGKPVDDFADMQRVVSESAGDKLDIKVDRKGTPLVLTATPALKEVKDNFGNAHRIGILGITRSMDADDMKFQPVSPPQAVVMGVQETWFIVDRTLSYIGGVIVGRESADQLGGPARIAQISGQVAKIGFIALIHLVGVLSVSIGLLNLFPIPLLDGGHLLFYAIEMLRGRPLSERAQEVGFRIGLAIVVMLMIFATFNDIVHLTTS